VYNAKMKNLVVAAITSNLKHAGDPASVLIDIATPDGKASGLILNSVVSCVNVATIVESLVTKKVGQFPASLMQRVNASLKVALALP
jgi:mRNA interferase MazF